MSWDTAFDEPVKLPNGKTARTLREAGQYISKLPKTEREHKTWQTAMHCLIEAAGGHGFISFARMGVASDTPRGRGSLRARHARSEGASLEP